MPGSTTVSAAPWGSLPRPRSGNVVASMPGSASRCCAPSSFDSWKPTCSTRSAGRCSVTSPATAKGIHFCSITCRPEGGAGGGSVMVVGGSVVVGGGAVVVVVVDVVVVVVLVVVETCATLAEPLLQAASTASATRSARNCRDMPP